MSQERSELNKNLAQMLKGGVIMDVTTPAVSYTHLDVYKRQGKGEVTQAGTIFRIVFGMPDEKNPAVFDQIKKDLTESGIGAVVSDNIRRDCLQKLACVSPMAATGAFYDATMGEIRSDPEMRGVYARLIGEISALADAMGLSFAVDVVAENLKILDNVTPDTTASMQKDLKRGSQTEMDGLIFEIVRLGKQYGVATPEYERIARHFGMKQ